MNLTVIMLAIGGGALRLYFCLHPIAIKCIVSYLPYNSQVTPTHGAKKGIVNRNFINLANSE